MFNLFIDQVACPRRSELKMDKHTKRGLPGGVLTCILSSKLCREQKRRFSRLKLFPHRVKQTNICGAFIKTLAPWKENYDKSR